MTTRKRSLITSVMLPPESGDLLLISAPRFEMHGDGVAYVKEPDWPNIYGPDCEVRSAGDPALKMSAGMAIVPEEDVEAAIESAEECPGEYIFLEAE